ncbi:MAG: hypothetical protein HFJ17_00060 [Clostridia bacterium]|nr:hypothetical protein [Clostridia bacterium]
MNNKIISKVISGIALCSMMTYTIPVFGYTKDETVYSKLDKDGKQYKTIVSTYLQNSEELKTINDISDLINIKNTNGEETYSQDGKSLKWKAEGSDIYYQGESSKELPISCKVKYELDGKEISSDKILGKSGKVKITLEYTNNEERTVNINGKNEKMYVPFIVAAGTVIDNSKNRDIEVSNGKIANDGSKTVVLGLALPGMQESLDISKTDIAIPHNIEITMDTTDFEQNSIITYVTPKIIEDSDLDIFDKLDEMYSKINTLQSSSKELQKGANTLKEGTEEYSKKSKEFNNAMKQISGGVSTVNTNYSQINKGISSLNEGSSKLKMGAESLNKGIGQLSSALNSLPESAKALYDGTKSLNTGINGKNGLITGVKTVEKTLETALTTSTKMLSANNKVLNSEITELTAEAKELGGQIKTLSSLKDSLSGTEQDALLKTIEQMQTRQKGLTARITELTKQEKTNEAVIEKLQPTKESQVQLKALNSGMETISKGIQSLEDNLSKLKESAGELPASLKQLSDGSSSLFKGTTELSKGASTLNKGSEKLNKGINTLDTNTTKLTKANNQLTKASNKLSKGATTLAKGMTKFNKEGIQKICNYINGDVKDISTRVQKLQELSDEYNNFTELKDGNNGDVKFIMITDSIKHDDVALNTDINNNEKNEEK